MGGKKINRLSSIIIYFQKFFNRNFDSVVSLTISSFSLAAIKNEFAEQIQLYYMKKLRKNQTQKNPTRSLATWWEAVGLLSPCYIHDRVLDERSL